MSASDSLDQLRPAPLKVVQGPGRVPPQNLDAERSVLGGILLDNAALDEVMEIIGAEDFYRQAHRKVFEAIVALSVKGEPIDRVTLKAELELEGAYEAVGGEDFVDLLDTIVPSAANLAYYARIVADKSVGRRLIEAAHAIATQGYEQAGEAAELLEQAEQRIFAIRRDSTQHSFVTPREAVKRVMKEVEARYERGEDLTGVSSGIHSLDRFTCGFQPGNLVIVGARTSMGKSAFAMGCARAACGPDEGAAAVFSLEMSVEELTTRLLASESGVSLQKLRTGKRIAERDWAYLADACSRLAMLELHINDSVRTMLDIRAKSRRLASKLGGKLKLIVVDYLQLMTPPPGTDGREEAVAANSRELKALAKELQVPIIVPAQLNRECEKRPNPHKRPQLSDLRESGAVEHDADVVLFLYRGEVYGDDSCEKGVAEIIVGKQRNGPVGTAKAAWASEVTAFRNLREDQQQLGFGEPPPPESENP